MGSCRETVVILCGGYGRRLGARGKETPKVLTPVDGKPMLFHILSQFRSQGFHRFVFATGYLSEQVEAFLRTHFGHLDYVVSNAGADASMLKRIYDARQFFSEQVIISYGDTFIDIDYASLLKVHKKSKRSATIVVSAFKNPFGVVTFDTNTNDVVSFDEKPTLHYYIGGLALREDITELISEPRMRDPDGTGIVKLFQSLAANRQLGAYPHTGLQATFNTESEIAGAEMVLRRYYTVKESQ
jgi:glucose-1-phosphate cytidylyltransferase